MPYLVRPGLYIGNITDASTTLISGHHEISHILSLFSSSSISFFTEWRSEIVIEAKEIKKCVNNDDKVVYCLEYAGKDLKFVRMGVTLRDMESENLLDCLDVCLGFIDESRRDGGCVLVHCFAGVSRSAAIITAYLMRTEQLSLEDALESLRLSCEHVCPNDGFLDQLKMFEDMGFKVDQDSSIYKRFRLKILGDSYSRGDRIDSSHFAVDPALPPETVHSANAESADRVNKPSLAYRCQNCRRVVAVQENVIGHIPGEGEACFNWQKRSPHYWNKTEENECSSIFVEPLRWMKIVEEGGIEGKLSCVQCDARLGNFNWSGIQCSCGSWITPAFQLHKSRVDISTL